MLYPGVWRTSLVQMSSSSAAAASSSSSEQTKPAASATPGTAEDPKVVWRSDQQNAPMSSGHRERSSSRASRVPRSSSKHGRGGSSRSSSIANLKRSGKGENGPKNKKKRVLYDYKINIWNGQGALKEPISLADWRIMNTQLCVAAANKMRSSGPPKGGVGQKHWMEHSDGTRKTSELPDSHRLGHTVIRFSTIEAQEWYRPLVDTVLGIAQDGKPIKLTTEVEEDDGRARYVFSLPAADFHAFGKSKGEREELLVDSILAATGAERAIIGHKDVPLYSSFLHEEKNGQEMWKCGMKFPALLETQLDAIMQGEKFGILPTAITSIRVLKKQNSSTGEARISRAMMKTTIAGPPQRSGSTDSVKRARSLSSQRSGMATKKVADGPTPDKK